MIVCVCVCVCVCGWWVFYIVFVLFLWVFLFYFCLFFVCVCCGGFGGICFGEVIFFNLNVLKLEYLLIQMSTFKLFFYVRKKVNSKNIYRSPINKT